MAKERKSWEEDSAIVDEVKKESAPAPAAPAPLMGKASESSTLRDSAYGRQDEDTNGEKSTTNLNDPEGSSHPPEGTTV